jgi:predicted phage baseplate assembly protein
LQHTEGVLEAPDLDDRKFQDLVDGAKRRIQLTFPAWTDHNVSDPGVALIELFAWMTELTLYRLNQVPDRLSIKFLEMIGTEPYAAVPAKVELTFMLSTPLGSRREVSASDTVVDPAFDSPSASPADASQPRSVPVPRDTPVGSSARSEETPVIFRTDEHLTILRARLASVLTTSDGVLHKDQWAVLDGSDSDFRMFPRIVGDDPTSSGVPQDGVDAHPDVVVLGFDSNLSAHQLRFDVVAPRVEGVAIEPKKPPVVWECWTDKGWAPAEVISDETGGFNRTGSIRVTLARGMARLTLESQMTQASPSAARVRHGAYYWVRIRHDPTIQPNYGDSPKINDVRVATEGARCWASHAELRSEVLLGLSNGRPAQEFPIGEAPILARDDDSDRDPPELVVTVTDGYVEEWSPVENFSQSGPQDRHVVWSRTAGTIRFGPAIREDPASSVVTQHGSVPPPGAEIRISGHRVGGGRRGNCPPDRLTVLRTTIPFIASVTNRKAAAGGADPETVEQARARGPLWLRAADRAVTREDHVRIVREASPLVKRVECLSLPEQQAGDRSVDAARLLAAAADQFKRASNRKQLSLSDGMQEILQRELDRDRVIGNGFELGVSESAQVLVVPDVDASAPDAEAALAPTREQLKLPADLRKIIVEELKKHRIVGSAIELGVPDYVGVSIVVSVSLRKRGDNPRVLREEVRQLLLKHLHPLRGGDQGSGWPLGEPVLAAHLLSVLEQADNIGRPLDLVIFNTRAVNGGEQRSGKGMWTLPLTGTQLPLVTVPPLIVVRDPKEDGAWVR